MLQTGIKGIKEITVTQDKTAKAMGSGTLDVFATPAMIALMENTAYESVASELEPGSGTVGTALNVRHVSASPVGMKIKCETELTKVDGRALTFSVKAYDEAGLIGEGEHERFIIFEEKFKRRQMKKQIRQDVLNFIDKFSDSAISAYSGQSAFFLMLSFFPFMLFSFHCSI